MNSIDFKDEAAVKDYIDRLGVEYRFQCFGEGRTDGCHRLGDWLEFSMKDWVKAGRVYKSNCLNSLALNLLAIIARMTPCIWDDM